MFKPVFFAFYNFIKVRKSEISQGMVPLFSFGEFEKKNLLIPMA